MSRFARSVLVLGLTMTATMADAQTLQERSDRAEKMLIETGTAAAHMNSIRLVAQLIARDRVCPPDNALKAHLAYETANQAKETGLARDVIAAKAEAFVPLFVEFLNSDPTEKKLACTP